MKVRSDFVTNSSSSSFVVLSVNSKSFTDIIRRFQEELAEQGWFTVTHIDDSSVSIYGDELYAQTPASFSDIVPSLARMFYEEVYIPGELSNEEADEQARLAFEEDLDDSDEDDWGSNLGIRIAKDIVDARTAIESDLESINMTCGDVGWGGDSDSRYEKENYTEAQLKKIYKSIADEKGCSIEDIDDDDFYSFVGGYTSNSEDTYTYDKSTNREEHFSHFQIDI